jgi:small subunit ribosomal protein S6
MTKDTALENKAQSDIGLYELMLILNPELRESEVNKKLEEYEDMIVKSGGKVTSKDYWGKRALAYRIKRKDDGLYMVYNATMPAPFLKEIKEALRIDKEVIRSLVIKLPEGQVYTKYDLTYVKEEPRKKEFFVKKSMGSMGNTSIKHSGPSAMAKPEKSEDKGKEANAVDLDKKLDAMLGGSDLKL